jgi:bacteriocin-like protein
MKSINNFKELSKEQLNQTIGGYYIMVTLPNGQVVRVRV